MVGNVLVRFGVILKKQSSHPSLSSLLLLSSSSLDSSPGITIFFPFFPVFAFTNDERLEFFASKFGGLATWEAVRDNFAA